MLQLLGGDAGAPLRAIAEFQLPDRERMQPVIAKDADIDLASVDELLDDGIGADLLMDEGHTLDQFLVVVDQ